MITVALARQIYDVLIQHAGAPADHYHRDTFVAYQFARQNSEYRFGGWLGFGGKFRVSGDRWYVDYYPEDRTPERDAVVEATNAALANLRNNTVT